MAAVQLSNDVLLLVMSNLSRSDAFRAMRVCRAWKTLVERCDGLWRREYALAWPLAYVHGPSKVTWFALFRSRWRKTGGPRGAAMQQVEGCREAECPVVATSWLVSTLPERVSQRMCPHCKEYVPELLEAEAGAALRAGKRVVPSHWKTLNTPDGRVYFYHPHTHLTSWSKPV